MQVCFPLPRGFDDCCDSMTSPSKLAAVHIVGSYQCSVVPDLLVPALRASVDWRRFKQPKDWKQRLAVLEDRALIPVECVRKRGLTSLR